MRSKEKRGKWGTIVSHYSTNVIFYNNEPAREVASRRHVNVIL